MVVLGLEHRGQGKMTVILRNTVPTSFSWMKVPVFWFKFHGNLFPRVPLITSQHWVRKLLGIKQETSHFLNQWWPSLLTHITKWVDISRVSCQKGPTHHAYAWQIGPFWQDALDMLPLFSLSSLRWNSSARAQQLASLRAEPGAWRCSSLDRSRMACDQTECAEPSPLGWICSKEHTEHMVFVMSTWVSMTVTNIVHLWLKITWDISRAPFENIISYTPGCEYFDLDSMLKSMLINENFQTSILIP